MEARDPKPVDIRIKSEGCGFESRSPQGFFSTKSLLNPTQFPFTQCFIYMRHYNDVAVPLYVADCSLVLMNKFKGENGRSLKKLLSEQFCRRNDKTLPLSQNKENQNDIDKNNPIVKV